ncbi:MAG: hypothetical protein ABSD31_15940, partial [Candidatus Binataceae bacterium]
NLRPGAGEGVEPAPAYPDARQALQYLTDSPVRRRALWHEEKLDIEALVHEVLQVRDRSRALAEEREHLRKWIADLWPWGNFELPPEWAAGRIALVILYGSASPDAGFGCCQASVERRRT